ncbi:MAG: hypothetical protein ACP5D9_00540 [Mariniphaga sp.]
MLATSMVLVIANRIVFTHSHILDNGEVISHAHPYDKTNDSEPFKSHHHTQAELFFFQNIEIFFPFVFILLKLIYLPPKEKYFIFSVKKVHPVNLTYQNVRAPPVLSI